MSGKCFLDTNVLVYVLDQDAGTKRRQAETLARNLTREGRAVISTQVLQEFHVTVTRKLARPLGHDDALEATRLYARLPTIQIRTSTILEAAHRTKRDQLSFWDALIVEAALEAKCTILHSEDFQDGRRFGTLRVVNPFRNP